MHRSHPRWVAVVAQGRANDASVPLALVLAVVLAAESQVPDEEHPTHAEQAHGQLIGLMAGAVVVGTAAALGSWLDRDGTVGRVSAITAGSLAIGAIAASLGALIASRVYLGQANATSSLMNGAGAADHATVHDNRLSEMTGNEA